MSDINTGGPAFPVEFKGPCNIFGLEADKTQKLQFSGMTLRDYFAAKAMQSYLQNSQVSQAIAIEKITYKEICEAAYQWADTMLKAREI